ncbi:hypothetical protein [Cellulosimicrobium sp. SL-1]|uniref:hypothetical protein n=1 Tax=Cellulosimicrobium sp. SL-1 TaxID=2699423 RepID=UPI0013D2A16D|nr:hypothetical protein [Cellulosimicrobium sp. SL-1]
MGAARALELRAVTVDGLVEVVPYVDGRSLVDVVGRFESARGYSPAGAYGGLVPASFRYGDAAHQWYGRGRVPAGGRAWVLACDCHEAGCWPFEVAVAADATTVTWRDLTQPFRPEWDYSALGPFTFDRAQYDDAVRAVAHLFG